MDFSLVQLNTDYNYSILLAVSEKFCHIIKSTSKYGVTVCNI